MLIYATHILIDYFTVYGTQLLAPLSRNGFALGNFFIVDPLFTIPLLAYFSIFDTPSKAIRFYFIPKRPELIERISGTRTFAVVEWFSQGWWYAIEDGENRVKVVDLRFTEIPSTFGQTYHEWDWPFSWTFYMQTPHKKSLYSVLPELDAPLQTLALLTGRIRGGKDWYPTSTGFSIEATVTLEGALRHSAKEQQPL